MNKNQILLKKWIDKNFENITITFIKNDMAMITDCNGDTMTVKFNQYYDVLEYPNDKLLAISNLPHDRDVSNYTPQTWQELPY